jgi:hypothetical protein
MRERIIAADTEHEMACVLRHLPELPHHIVGTGPIDCQ